jgi:GNAT superfamily N-acetyltransferase
MTFEDAAAVERVSAEAFYDLDVRMRQPNWPDPELRSAERAGPWIERLQHMIKHDGPGCWVVEDDEGRIIGEIAAILREGLWGLSSFAVLPDVQAKGAGKAMLDAALGHGDSRGPGIICSSGDPRAIRRYRLAGFVPHPAMLLWGEVDRTAIPRPSGGIREARAQDADLLDAIDRQVRGAGRGPDHPLLLEQLDAWIIERGRRRGYVYHRGGGHVYQLAASDPETAQRLMWQVLAGCPVGEPADLHNLTAEQVWAVDVGLAAGMELHVNGYLALRNLAPPTPYIPSGHFL